MAERIAFIGLGIMGGPMAGHLLKSGADLTVFNRTRTKAQPLAAAGAKVADSPAAAAQEADIVFLCLTDTPDVDAVLFGDGGIADAMKAGSIVVDHSTVSPAASERWAARLAEKQIGFIDAPVSGGDSGARAGTLSIMCGGQAADVDRVRPFFAAFGKTVTHCGVAGQGQATKLVNQVLVLGTLAAVCEAMLLTQTAGLDPATTLAAVGGGAAKSWQLEQLWPKIAAGDFAPGFRIDLALKDLRLVTQYAAERHIALPGVDRVRGLYETLVATGHATEGTQAMIKAMKV
ncbi:MAG: NAD(P)-dependent oxidoreductase [Tepidisphaeraceae bacterium]